MSHFSVETLDKSFRVTDIDKEHLQRVVRPMGYLTRLIHFDYVPIGEQSYSGKLYRFHIELVGKRDQASSVTVILKETGPTSSQFTDPIYPYRELRCYEYNLFSNLDDTSLSVPQVYRLQIDTKQQRCWIWMEDYPQAFTVKWTSSLVLDAVHDLAKLYGVWWGQDETLSSYAFLRKLELPVNHSNWKERLIRNCRLLNGHPNRQLITLVFTKSRQQMLQKLSVLNVAIYRLLGQLTKTLLHQDLWFPNIGRVENKTVLIDWSNASMGPPGLDLSLFYCMVAQTEMTLDSEALLETLYRSLAEEQKIPVSRKELTTGYELSFCLRPASILGACILRDILDERPTITGMNQLEWKLNASERIFQCIEQGIQYL